MICYGCYFTLSSCIAKLITLVIIATSQICHFFRFLQLPYFGVGGWGGVRAAAKVWVAPTTNFTGCELPVLVVQTMVVEKSSVE